MNSPRPSRRMPASRCGDAWAGPMPTLLPLPMVNVLDGGVHADNPVDVHGGHRGAPQCAAGKPIVHIGRRIPAAVEDLASPYLLDRAHRDGQPLRDRLALVDLHEVQVVLRDLGGRGLAVPAPAA